MESTINMQDMRYLNLFQRVTKVRTRYCFLYNETIVFGVPRKLLSKALGKDAENIKKIGNILGKRVRIVALPRDIEDAEDFLKNIISPIQFKELEVNEDEIVITAGKQNKASLIGRDKKRLHDMQKIVKSFFGKDVRVV